ncbi:MAG: OmpA family protein [Bacteroidia bacterium]|nr:OmpA family protein [Bacteroidia bacterium]
MRLDILAAAAALLLWIGGGSWYWTCKVKGHCDEISASPVAIPTPEPTSLPSTEPGFFVEAEGEKLFLRMDALYSKIGSSDLEITPSLQEALDSLGAYMTSHEGAFLEITGKYLNGVDGESSQLALNRAKALGMMMIGKGLTDDRLVYSYASSGYAFAADSLLPAASAKILPPREEATEVIAELLEPRNLYFDFGKTDLPIEDSFRTYCGEVIRYLRAHPEAAITVTGHTDNKGNAARNKEIGMGRAETVSAVLASFGVPSSQLKASSEGMARPIADNATEEGRALNRRVEVRLFAGNE